jgi:hypothetical protein
MREAQKTWRKLLELRDDMIREKVTIVGKDGEPREIYVVASHKDFIACCKEILNRAVGAPAQEVDVKSKEGLTVIVRTFDPDADSDKL